MKRRSILMLIAIAIVAVGPWVVAEDHPPSAEVDSIWVTSIAKGGSDDTFIAATASGLLLRPADIVSFEASDPTKFKVLYSHPAAAWRVVATDDGKTVASVDYRGNLMTFDTASGEAKTFEKAFERWSQSLILTPDQKSLVAGNEAGKVFVWNLADGKVAKSIELDGHAVTGLAISPDGNRLAASDGGGHVHLLSLPSLESAGKIEFGEEPVWSVAFVDGGKNLLVGSGDRTLYKCEATDAAKSQSVLKGTDWITTIAVSPSGQVAAGEVGGSVHFLVAGSKPMTAPSGVWAMAWNGDRQLFVGTRKNGVVAATQSWDWAATPSASPEKSDAANATKDSDGSTDE